MLKRYFIELSYLGTHYHGWQIQPNAITVQQKINEALQTLFKKEFMITGCGRTDAGVHAKAFYAHVDLDFETVRFPTIQLVYKLNAILPDDIAIHDVFEVDHNAHARFDATARTYEYHLTTKKDIFRKELSYFLPFRNVDFQLMNQAAAIMMEYKDFECFSKTGTDVHSFNCEISSAKWEQLEDGYWIFTIRADRFLRNMVRAIVGTLLEVGRAHMRLNEFRQVIESKDRSNAGWSVPGKGLFLTKVEYPFIQS